MKIKFLKKYHKNIWFLLHSPIAVRLTSESNLLRSNVLPKYYQPAEKHVTIKVV